MVMQRIWFVTTNKHKVSEARQILKPFNLEVKQIDTAYDENHDSSMELIAKNACKKLASQLNKPVVVEDTGFFFAAYNNFPGALPKYIFESIGYEGILKLLEAKDREAYTKAVVGYCEPGKKPQIFDGVMNGIIAERVYDKNKDVMPYERIFIPEGFKVTLSKLSRNVKNEISHRRKAFEKLGKYLVKK
jgi:XTP/dITP diphosphohydrolase